MAVMKASITWPGRDNDVLRLFVEPTPEDWIVDPDETGLLAVFHEVDPDERETGRIAGVEIIDFLEFERWADLPDLDMLWQLPGQEPLPLETLLRRVQSQLLMSSESKERTQQSA